MIFNILGSTIDTTGNVPSLTRRMWVWRHYSQTPQAQVAGVSDISTATN